MQLGPAGQTSRSPAARSAFVDASERRRVSASDAGSGRAAGAQVETAALSPKEQPRAPRPHGGALLRWIIRSAHTAAGYDVARASASRQKEKRSDSWAGRSLREAEARGGRRGRRRVACESRTQGGSRIHRGSFACRRLLALRQVADGLHELRRAGLVGWRVGRWARAGAAQSRDGGRGAGVDVGSVPWRSSSRAARRPPPAEGRRLVTAVHRVLWPGVRLRGLSGVWG